MIILDTNVIAEPMKKGGNQSVTRWLDEQTAESLYITSINLAEIFVGIEFLPNGKRKEELRANCEKILTQLFGQRILPFDEESAIAYASIVSKARSKGHSISVADAQIAAIATIHGFAVATRDESPFAIAGINVINPWTQKQFP